MNFLSSDPIEKYSELKAEFSHIIHDSPYFTKLETQCITLLELLSVCPQFISTEGKIRALLK